MRRRALTVGSRCLGEAEQVRKHVLDPATLLGVRYELGDGLVELHARLRRGPQPR